MPGLAIGEHRLEPPCVDAGFERVQAECYQAEDLLRAEILQIYPKLQDALETIESLATDAELEMFNAIENALSDCQDKGAFEAYIDMHGLADAAERIAAWLRE